MSTFMATLLLLGMAGVLGAFFVPTLAEILGPARLQVAAVVAVLATLSSLYFSGIADLVPCRYCWWQRIFMYPLAFVLPIAAWRRDQMARWYALPLAGTGLLVSLRHIWIQEFPDDGGSCDLAAPCSVKLVDALGIFSIPRMTALTFVLLILLLVPRPVPALEESS